MMELSCLSRLLHFAFLLLWIITGSLFWLSRIYGPTLAFQYPDGQYEDDPVDFDGKDHLPLCTLSTDNVQELVINNTLTNEETQELVLKHGAAIFPSILSKDTAQRLKNYALEANEKLTPLYVHSKASRVHITPPHTVPIIQETLQQVACHSILRPVLDGLLGPSATLMSLSIITSHYGAADQNFHPDSSFSYNGFPDFIVPEYTVAIALQDTTPKMGATALCPGTHECSYLYINSTEQRQEFIEASRNQTFHGSFAQYQDYAFPCNNITASTQQGDAVLYSSDLLHAGRAHQDPNAESRSQLFITLAGSRQSKDDKRELPIGNYWTLDRRSWGQTIDDFTTIKERPWRLWHVVGLGHGKKDVIPWNIVDGVKNIFRYHDQTAYMIELDVMNAEYLNKLVDKLLRFTVAVTGVYMSTLCMCFVYKRVR